MQVAHAKVPPKVAAKPRTGCLGKSGCKGASKYACEGAGQSA